MGEAIDLCLENILWVIPNPCHSDKETWTSTGAAVETIVGATFSLKQVLRSVRTSTVAIEESVYARRSIKSKRETGRSIAESNGVCVILFDWIVIGARWEKSWVSSSNMCICVYFCGW